LTRKVTDILQGEICAWHYATRQPVKLCWQEGVITHLEPAPAPPATDLWLAPGLFDLQVNGYGGIDFQQDDLGVDGLITAALQLRAAGCTRFLLTLVTDEWPAMTARLQRLCKLRAKSAMLQSAIVGWHIEGPFLSAEPGFHGAHDAALMIDPSPAHIQELRAITGVDPLLLTLAPERPGAMDAIALATSLGIKVSLGHTDASAETLRRAIEAGATGFTHLGNGCTRALDRHDNILWRVLDASGLTVSLIPDQIHISPPLFRLFHRMIGPDSICHISDAMSAAGAPPGRYKLGKKEAEVGPDQIVRLPGESNFAGSALRPIDGIFRAAQMLNCAWQEVWDRASGTPGKMMGLTSSLSAGQPVNFCLLHFDSQNRLAELQVCSRDAT
jgi:N-acetylglucosamine-6-phosphate deacetylase